MFSFFAYCRIVTFQKKSDAVCVCLVFDSNKLPDFQKGSGYHHPQKFTEPPQGMDSYPAIFLYPPVSFCKEFVMLLGRSLMFNNIKFGFYFHIFIALRNFQYIEIANLGLRIYIHICRLRQFLFPCYFV